MSKTKAVLKKDIVKGQVLILLGGRFRGKRVVFLKMLDSGLLLVSGPRKINGVPLKRVHQRMCIATSTKVDASKVDVKAVTDDYFKREKTGKADEFFAQQKYDVPECPEIKKKTQKAVDAAIKITDPVMQKYLKARFALRNKDFPHQMKF